MIIPQIITYVKGRLHHGRAKNEAPKWGLQLRTKNVYCYTAPEYKLLTRLSEEYAPVAEYPLDEVFWDAL